MNIAKIFSIIFMSLIFTSSTIYAQAENPDEQMMDSSTQNDPDMNLSIDELQVKLDAANSNLESATQKQTEATDNLNTILNYYQEPVQISSKAKDKTETIAKEYQDMINKNPLADADEHKQFLDSLKSMGSRIQESSDTVNTLQLFLQAKIDEAQQRKAQTDQDVLKASNEVDRLQNIIKQNQ